MKDDVGSVILLIRYNIDTMMIIIQCNEAILIKWSYWSNGFISDDRGGNVEYDAAWFFDI